MLPIESDFDMTGPDDAIQKASNMPFSPATTFIVFDLETTGLSPAFHRIVEIGAIRFRADGTELAQLNQLVNPLCRIPAEVTQIHGITDEMVRGMPSIDAVLPQFLDFITGPDTILLAHNASFDVGFISAALGRCGLDAPNVPTIDTVELARWKWPRLRNHKLETIARHLRIADRTEHRALGDVEVLKSVFENLISRPRPIETLDHLIGISPPYSFESIHDEPSVVPDRHQFWVEVIKVRRSVSIVYDGGTKGRTSRQITPRNLTQNRGSLYLVAYCHIDGIEKSFRLDRIVEVG